ncbi:PREDICTED: epoxide hydrolase [Prunus dulcis]|uniref:PREDICTED: epoxide hydrolase n=1 Tax=Prunus dulcis TaxID=3755 RepID=A0A5E4E4Q2_PRUDU|nr:hypothetical protein L3X38_039290 [Prunus dulcis]VVA09730.1 PREDICTED: epoxide hydrolase [Prunus dulcis]
MVNWVALQRPLLHGLMKMAGVRPYTVELEPGTSMNFWVPNETLDKPKKGQKPTVKASPTKPVVVLVHGFAAEGIVTWQFQIGALSKKYSVYVPDLLFFGGSATDKADRSPTLQAECLAAGLRKLGVERCTVVGFSYGGMVGFKLAELYPDMVRALVVSGSILAMTCSVSDETMERLGCGSSSELLLPSSVKGLKNLLSIAAHKKLYFPDRLHKDFLEVMFTNRKEREELLEGLVIDTKDPTIPKFPQRIHLLWGENDQIFQQELAHNMKEQLGENATFEGIKKAERVKDRAYKLSHNCLYRAENPGPEAQIKFQTGSEIFGSESRVDQVDHGPYAGHYPPTRGYYDTFSRKVVSENNDFSLSLYSLGRANTDWPPPTIIATIMAKRSKAQIQTEISQNPSISPKIPFRPRKILKLSNTPTTKPLTSSSSTLPKTLNPLTSQSEVDLALQHLRSSDPNLTALIDSYSPPSSFDSGRPFLSLARSILYQQLATKAAQSIYTRFISLCGGEESVVADVVASLSAQQL